jgi:hypothetical protein
MALMLSYVQPQRVASDGVFYYAPLRSVVVDRDLDFENEYRVLGALPIYFGETSTGRLPNHHSVGPAFVWLPFFLGAHALGWLGLFRATGFGYPYFTAIATGSLLAGFAGVVCVFHLVSYYVRNRAAVLLATLGVWLGTFHLWYMVFEPSMSHAIAVASVSALFLWCHRPFLRTRDYAIAGALAGAVALVRWQNVIFLPVAMTLVWLRTRSFDRKGVVVAGAALAGVMAPQLLFWRAIYGSFLLVPQGGGYLNWTAPEIVAVLFSSRHGLLSWSPILWLALIGLIGFARRERVFGGALILSGALALYVNASVHDWWAGASFGARRFDGMVPAFGLGLAVSLEWLLPRVQRRPALVVGLGLAPFALWNAMLIGTYFGGTIPKDGPASFRQVASDGVELLYRYTGYPFSWPASVWETARTGQPLGTYDLSGALSPSNNVEIRMGDTDALYLGEGWSLPGRGRSETWREVIAERATLYVSLREPAPYTLRLVGVSGAPVEVFWNKDSLGNVEIEGDSGVEVTVSSTRVRPGINEIALAPVDRRGGRVRITRLALRRPGELESENDIVPEER